MIVKRLTQHLARAEKPCLHRLRTNPQKLRGFLYAQALDGPRDQDQTEFLRQLIDGTFEKFRDFILGQGTLRIDGEIIFLLLGMWAASGLAGTIFGGVLNLGWAIFHILIVLLQAYIFMMLTVVYLAMAEESH